MNHSKYQINKTFVVIVLFIVTTFNLFSQKEKKTLRSGNDDYKSGKYANAEKKYLQSINEKQSYLTIFNMFKKGQHLQIKSVIL